MKTIPLTQGRVAIVDDSDYDYLSQFKWYAKRVSGGLWYARRNVNLPTTGERRRQTAQYMHRVIAGTTESQTHVDHHDGNGLNNQRHNLRPCTHQQNLRNQKKNGTNRRFKGVWFDSNRFRAAITVNDKRIHLGRFQTEEEAARAYDSAATARFGEFARLNFPAEPEG